MILSKLEIHGFKSFAKRTKFVFRPGITGIVGPNGCGKSNIVDAIRWVMGEQKGSILRSERMEQVIFNGSESRKPLGMSEVSITLDNNDGLLPSEYSEILVSRRIYRNGESEYYINKKRRRLKDVVDLFLDTGLGADSYGIIEPSLINKILSNNPQERRTLFEEAAGIARYKLRVKSAQRRLENVNDNLERITDILAEVEKNVRKLKRQYNQAKNYEEIREKYEEIGVMLLAFERSKLCDELEFIKDEIAKFNNELEILERRKKSQEEKLIQISNVLDNLDVKMQEVQDEWNKLNNRIIQAENRLLIIDEKERNYISEIERSKEFVERGEQQAAILDEKIKNLQSSVNELDKVILEIGDKSKTIEDTINKMDESVKLLYNETLEFENRYNQKRSNANRLESAAIIRLRSGYGSRKPADGRCTGSPLHDKRS